mmetsp:Transcript_10524/g.33481  ORF Transcript_10524/g.33481 Transcript_10524/m.33481 type:complete len:547 (-) Transcript_10524:188-1828(-)
MLTFWAPSVPLGEVIGAAMLVGVAALVLKCILEPYLLIRKMRAQGIRGLPFRPLVGNLRELREMRLRDDVEPFSMVTTNFATLCAKGPKMYTALLGPLPRVIVGDPDAIKEILVLRNDAFGKPNAMKAMAPMLGNGLLLSEGSFHARQRRLIHPAFQHSKLRQMVQSMGRATAKHLVRWRQTLEERGAAGAAKPADGFLPEVDLHKSISALTLDILGSAAMGVDSLGDGHTGESVYVAMSETLDRFVDTILSGQVFIPFFSKLPLPNTRYVQKRMASLSQVLMRVIKERRRCVEQRQGSVSAGMAADMAEASAEVPLEDSAQLLDLLLSAFDEETNTQMTDKQLFDEAMTFMLAGHETTSQLMAWTIYLLAQHPDWKEQCREEARSVLPTDPADLTWEHVQQLRVINMVLQEALRLFPPAPMIGRRANRPVRIGGILIPKDMEVTIPIWYLHHNPELWDEPDKFNPERFRNGPSKAGRHPMAFIPFSVGKRNCIGQNFAVLEAKVMLAMLVRQFDFKLSPTHKHRPLATITLRPKYGLPCLLKPLE